MNRPPPFRSRQAFTLIELLVVISIIVVLMGLAFPAFQGVQNAAKKTQAKNDLVQIVTAVNACYTEYGQYPVLSTVPDGTFNDANNDQLFNILRGAADQGEQLQKNPRRIPFLTIPVAKEGNRPRSGLAPTGPYQYKWVDPWGTPYFVRMDYDYDNNVPNPYSAGAGFDPINIGCIAWSLGLDTTGGSGNKTQKPNADDVISWQ